MIRALPTPAKELAEVGIVLPGSRIISDPTGSSWAGVPIRGGFEGGRERVELRERRGDPVGP